MERLEARWNDPVQRAHFLKWMWIVSTAFMFLGFAVMGYLLLWPK